MSLRPGDLVDVAVEKPASGGRMIARHEGQVLLVVGAIPGERVTARVTRAEKQVAFAEVARVLDASDDRQEPLGDPACGGCLYAHIAYARQVQLKADVIRDAFVRIGRIPLDQRIPVAASPDSGYRMRARFHVRNGRAWFYRENTHETCDPRDTGQLSLDAADAVDAAVAALAAHGVQAQSVEMSENVAADQRAIHVDGAPSRALDSAIAAAVETAQLTGATIAAASDTASSGNPIVADPLSILTAGRVNEGALGRHPQAFFQGNRFLIADLVRTVLEVQMDGPVLDLYAGVGLFSVAIAADGRSVTAVEGSPVSATDLERNAARFADRLRVVRESVEAFLQRRGSVKAATIVVDPPRTGMSKGAADSIVRLRARRIIYVSCDPPTMARDARRLLDAGYRLTALQGFDLFPNTPHVESVGVFDS